MVPDTQDREDHGCLNPRTVLPVPAGDLPRETAAAGCRASSRVEPFLLRQLADSGGQACQAAGIRVSVYVEIADESEERSAGGDGDCGDFS